MKTILLLALLGLSNYVWFIAFSAERSAVEALESSYLSRVQAVRAECRPTPDRQGTRQISGGVYRM